MTIEMQKASMLMKPLQYFSEMLDYPQPDLPLSIHECRVSLIQAGFPDIANLLNELEELAKNNPDGMLKEIYTGIFDLNPSFYPYVGFHLFGESHFRSLFMVELKKRYREHGFTKEKELPDHFSVMLQFIARNTEAELGKELITDALLPVLEKLYNNTKDIEEKETTGRALPHAAYYNMLLALLLLLKEIDSQKHTSKEGGK